MLEKSTTASSLTNLSNSNAQVIEKVASPLSVSKSRDHSMVVANNSSNASTNRINNEEDSQLCSGSEKPIVVEYQTPFPMKGEVRIERGFLYHLAGKKEAFFFRNYADSVDGFTLRHNSHEVLVWDKRLPNEASHMIKVFTVFRDATPNELYDMMNDPIFRVEWDTFRLEAFCIVRLNHNNDIGYYAAKSPMPFVANRDFVNQRTWHAAGRGEYIIFNTSVPHDAVPVNYLATRAKERNEKGEKCVRAVSKLTGHLLQPWVNQATGEVEGTAFTYITHVDPRGSIPKTLINYVTTKFAPKTIKRVAKALMRFKTWLPEQLASGNYTKDWEEPAEWWVSEEEEAGNPIRNLTIDFARENMKGLTN